MTILKGFYKAEWEHNQECDHDIRAQGIKINENLVKNEVLDLNNITLENCYEVVKRENKELYGV